MHHAHHALTPRGASSHDSICTSVSPPKRCPQRATCLPFRFNGWCRQTQLRPDSFQTTRVQLWVSGGLVTQLNPSPRSFWIRDLGDLGPEVFRLILLLDHLLQHLRLRRHVPETGPEGRRPHAALTQLLRSRSRRSRGVALALRSAPVKR